MKPLVIGTREDVAAFALAGIDGVVCTTSKDAAQAIAQVDPETLVVVSPEFAVAAPRDRLVVVLARSS